MKSAIAAARLGLLLAAVATPAAAQTIYPLNRAQILVGADFDLKVEFPGAAASADVKVTIDGEDAGLVLGKTPEIIANEDGLPQTAYWIRGARLATAGRHTVEAMAGSDKASVAWDAFATPEGRKAKNVILFIGDGLSMAHRTAARILSKGITEGRYGGELAIDDMPYMALVSTAGTDSVITDSANSMTAYTTGHKSCVNALGVYCAKNLRALAHPKVETIAELAKRKLGLAVGVVTNTEIEDATPAGMVAHTRLRSDYEDIVRMFYKVQPDVIMGGGATPFLPKRWDPVSYVDKFKEAGYAFAANASELAAEAEKSETRKLLGLFNDGNMDGALDRKLPEARLGQQVPGSAGSDAGGACRVADSVAQRQRLCADGRIGAHRQIQPLARLGACRLRHHHARRCGAACQGLRGQSQRHADHRRARPRASDLADRHLRRRGGEHLAREAADLRGGTVSQLCARRW